MNRHKKINNPLVSVIIPTYNRGHLIKRAIESVFNQTYKNIEVIVVDDASTDNTEEIILGIGNPKIIYIKQPSNSGPSVARNKGIEIAKGELIAFLDSDDQWYPEKLEKQVNLLLNSDKTIGAVYCGMEFYDYKTNKRLGEHIITVDIKKNFTSGRYFLTPPMVTVLAYKHVLDEVGGLDNNLKANEDTELAIRICKKYNFALVNESLVKVTRNHEQLMANNENYIQAREIIFNKHYDFLSKDILFGLAKQIIGYNILNNNLAKARIFIYKALRIKPMDLKTIIQLIILTIFPQSIKKFYNKKYKEAPKLSGLKTG